MIAKEERYRNLLEVLSERPEVWSMDDVETWLKIIRMEKYQDQFREMAVDGLLILELTEEDLEKEMNINVKLHRRKIIKAIEVLNDYSKYHDRKIEEKNAMGFGCTIKSANMMQNFEEEQDINAGTMFHDKNAREKWGYNNQIGQQQNNFENTILQEEDKFGMNEMEISSPRRDNEEIIGLHNTNMEEELPIWNVNPVNSEMKQEKKNQLIIQPIEGPQTNFYYIKDSGGRIGRHSNNEVVIYDESVSRHHAEIKFKDDEFYLKDVGSTTGTYIKIIDKITLEKGMIIEIGSYQFLVTETTISLNPEEQSSITLEIYDGPEDFEKNKYLIEDKGTIGRKVTNKLQFSEDLHMSNIHCKISLFRDVFILEDMDSTNGTWFRLSRETEESSDHILKDKSIFKIGNSAMYIAKRISNVDNLTKQVGILNYEEKSIANGNECYICCSNERDCLILPCKHNVSCIKCSKNFRECPICKGEIAEIVKIYKS